MVQRVSSTDVLSFVINGRKISIVSPTSRQVEAAQLYNSAFEERGQLEAFRSTNLYYNALSRENEARVNLEEAIRVDKRYAFLLDD